MKAQDERPNLPEMPPYRLGRHWNTIQVYLIPGIEDDIGELSEEMKKFMGICELLIDDKGIFRVCPHRLSAFVHKTMIPFLLLQKYQMN